jgi:hypothetical protein
MDEVEVTSTRMAYFAFSVHHGSTPQRKPWADLTKGATTPHGTNHSSAISRVPTSIDAVWGWGRMPAACEKHLRPVNQHQCLPHPGASVSSTKETERVRGFRFGAAPYATSHGTDWRRNSSVPLCQV